MGVWLMVLCWAALLFGAGLVAGHWLTMAFLRDMGQNPDEAFARWLENRRK